MTQSFAALYILISNKTNTYIAPYVFSLLPCDFRLNIPIFIIFNSFIGQRSPSAQDSLLLQLSDLVLCILAPRVVLVSPPTAPPHGATICRLMGPARPVEVLFFIVFLVAPGTEFDLHSLERCSFHLFDSSLESNYFSHSPLKS
jgi:hypothetical protein